MHIDRLNSTRHHGLWGRAKRSFRRWGILPCIALWGLVAVGCGDGDSADDTTAPTTTASPTGGTFTSAQSVELSCDDGAGSGCAATYYTIDGSTPTTESSLYSAAIAVDADLQLKFFSVDNAENAETVQTESYVIEPETPPAPVITAPTSGTVTNDRQPVVSGTAEEGSTVELFDTDGVSSLGTTTATGGSWTITSSTLADGTHSLTATASRGPGQTSAPSSAVSIIIDTASPEAPTVTGTSPSNNLTPTWTWTSGGGGNGTFRYKLNDSDLATGATETSTSSYTPSSPLDNGQTHTLFVQERNDAGNWSLSGSFAITIDASAPDAPVITTPVDGYSTNDSTVLIAGTAEPGSEVELFEVNDSTSVGTTVATGGDWSIETDPLALGEYVFTARATDAVGNESGDATSVTVRIGTYLYIADSANHRVVRVEDMSGTNWTTFGSVGSGAAQFGTLKGLYVGPDHRIYIADRSIHRIVRMDDMFGTGWVTFGSSGSGTNELMFPECVFVDANGKIYICDNGNQRIVRMDDMTGTGWTTFGSSGTGTNQFQGLGSVHVTASGTIYIVNRNNDRIVHINDMTGAGWTSFGTTGTGTHQFTNPTGFAMDRTGRIYLIDNSRLVRIDDMVGTNWVTFGTDGSGTHQFHWADAVSVDWAGRIYVADRGNNRVVRIDDMTGTGWVTYGSNGSGTNELDRPYDLFYR